MNKIIALVLFTAWASACGDNIDPVAPPVDSGIDAAAAKIRAVVVTPSNNFTPGQPGILSVLDLDTKTVTMGAGPAMAVGSDPILRKFGAELFIINRAENNITILDAVDLHLIEQVGTGAGSNPQDVAVVGNKLYVPTLGNKGMIELTRGSAATIEYDLGVDDPDGKPNCHSVYRVDSDLYVSCELLDDTNANLPPRGMGKVYVVDTATRMVTKTITLANANPFGLLEQIPEHAPNAGDLVIPSVDFATGAGCVERIAVGTNAASAGCIVTNAQLGNFASRVDFAAPEFTGPVTEAAIIPTQTMYVVVPRPSFDGSDLRRWNITSGMLEPEPVTPSTQSIVDVAICPDFQIVMSEAPSSPTAGSGGLRVYAPNDSSAPLAVGLKPSSSHGLVCY
jgi:YVTN family beta-propeller protein